VPLFWAAKSSQPDLIYLQNEQALLARMATHNQREVKETLAFLWQELSTIKEIYLIKF
jgi:hypothetical protein